MARFDVFALKSGGYVLDCQADLLSDLNTRFVVPLLPESDAPPPARQLNPVFQIEGKAYIMATQFCAAISTSELEGKVASLQSEDRRIMNALDMLISGC
jgi:toxin CcdB